MPIQGTIDQRGYTPPVGVIVHWSNGAQKPLDPSKPFAGWHDSDIPRYGGGDQSLASHHPSAVGVEQRGGEAFAILSHLFEQAGVGRQPNERETSDFAVVHGGRRVLGRSDWLRLTGEESPVKVGEPGSSARLAIPAHTDNPAFHGSIVEVDGKFYILDSVEQGLPPLPKSTKPTEPPPAPKPPPSPTTQPNPPAQQGRQVDIDFSEDLVFEIPAGATSVFFAGIIDLPSTIPGGIKPLIKVALGPRDGERVNAGLFKVTRDNTWGLEWDPDETRPLGGGKVKSGAIAYEWTPGKVSVKLGDRPARVNNTVPNQAVTGSVIVFGVDPPKPGSDKPAEYVRLLGGRLRGVLTITGGVQQPGPIVPPVDSPGDANLRALAAEADAKVQAAATSVAALRAAIERSGR